jgi:hypothetical protein
LTASYNSCQPTLDRLEKTGIYAIFQNKAATVITKLPVDDDPRPVICGMLLGLALLQVEGILWKLGC